MKEQHIPYRNSKLTMLLQDSLGGSARCVMVANVSPSEDDVDNTRSTLHTAHSAKSITNKPSQNAVGEDSALLKARAEIERLRLLLEESNKLDDRPGDNGAEHELEEQNSLTRSRMEELASYILIPKSARKAASLWRSNAKMSSKMKVTKAESEAEAGEKMRQLQGEHLEETQRLEAELRAAKEANLGQEAELEASRSAMDSAAQSKESDLERMQAQIEVHE